MQVYMNYWVEIPAEVRAKMREYFGVQRSTSTYVETGLPGGAKVRCDGSSNEDLKVISIEKLQALLKTDSTDFAKLLEDAVTLFKEKTVEEARAIAAKLQQEAVDEARQETEQAAELIHEVAKRVTKLSKKPN